MTYCVFAVLVQDIILVLTTVLDVGTVVLFVFHLDFKIRVVLLHFLHLSLHIHDLDVHAVHVGLGVLEKKKDTVFTPVKSFLKYTSQPTLPCKNCYSMIWKNLQRKSPQIIRCWLSLRVSVFSKDHQLL